MKDAEDEAFDDLAKRQGMWGGGYQAKRAMAADKLQEPVAFDAFLESQDFYELMQTYRHCQIDAHIPFEAVKDALRAVHTEEALAQPAQEPKREWVGLTDGEITEGLCRTKYAVLTAVAWVDGVEWATKQLKEKNSE